MIIGLIQRKFKLMVCAYNIVEIAASLKIIEENSAS